MSIYLSSRGAPGLADFIRDYAIGRRTCLVPIAADPAEDPSELIRSTVEAITSAALDVEFIAHAADGAEPPPPLTDFHVIVIGPGDPFYLLQRMRDLGLDAQLREAVNHGSVVVGIGAGAIVLGPSLDPWIQASHFAPEDGMYMEGLYLTETVALPHADDPERADIQAAIIRRYAGHYPVVPLADGEAVIVSSEGTRKIGAPQPAAG